METHWNVVPPIGAHALHAQATHPDRRRRERPAQPFELEVDAPKPAAVAEEPAKVEPRGANEEGVGVSVDVTA